MCIRDRSEYHFWRCEEQWRSRRENRSETVEFKSAIKRVLKVVAEAVIFNCWWGPSMYRNFKELEDGSEELSCQGESTEV